MPHLNVGIPNSFCGAMLLCCSLDSPYSTDFFFFVGKTEELCALCRQGSVLSAIVNLAGTKGQTSALTEVGFLLREQFLILQIPLWRSPLQSGSRKEQSLQKFTEKIKYQGK